MRKMRVSNDEIVRMYERKGCNITATCAALKIDRKTFYKRKDKFKCLAERLEEIDESLLDFAESKLMEHIQGGDVASLIFYLKTKGRRRGYVERVENEISGNAFERLMRELPDEESS